MRIEKTERKLYRFEELPEDIKDKAIENIYDINVDYDWWECTYEDAANIGLRITGFDIDRGNSITGELTETAYNVAKKIIAEHGKKCDTHKLAKKFIADFPKETNDNQDIFDEIEEEFKGALLEEYLVMLRHEYEYQTSREAIIETIEANGYEFDENGKLA